MAGPRYRDHGAGAWRPAFSPLAKPILCAGEGDVDCCALCAAWLDCVQRQPLRLDLHGFDCYDYLRALRFNALACCWEQNGDVSPTGEGYEPHDWQFRGTYLAMPSWFGGGVGAYGPPRHDGVWYTLPGLGIFTAANSHCGTHYGLGYRTIHTPQGQRILATRMYLDAGVACQTDGEGQPALQFYVDLFVIRERDDLGCTTLCSGCREAVCLRILASELIPLSASTTLADLVDVPLLPVASVTAADFTPSDCLPPCPGDDCPRTDGAHAGACCWSPPPGPIVFRDTAPPTPHYGNSISVLGDDCQSRACDYCDRPAPLDKTAPLVRAAIDFVWSGGGCYKTFTAVAPECLGELEYFWSFGKTGAKVGHLIANVDPGGAGFREDVTLVAIDARGCVYQQTKTVDCNCCDPPVSGTLTATPTGTCSYRLDATVGVTVACPHAFIQWWRSDGSFDPDCICDDDAGECPGMFSLGDGDHTALVVSGPVTIFWRVVSGPCGCPGPTHEIPLDCSPCACCTGTPGSAPVLAVSGVLADGQGGCDCPAVNAEYSVPSSGDACAGARQIVDAIPCDPGIGNVTLVLTWEIWCEPHPSLPGYSRYWLSLAAGYQHEGTFRVNGDTPIGTYQDPDKPTCAEISGSICQTIASAPALYCSAGLMCVSFSYS